MGTKKRLAKEAVNFAARHHPGVKKAVKVVKTANRIRKRLKSKTSNR